MNFKIGKKYLTRHGEIVTLARIDSDTGHFKNKNGDCFVTWLDSGQLNKHHKQDRDIIEEYIEPMNSKTLDLTKPLQTRDGHKVEIIGTSGRGNYPIYGYVGSDVCINIWSVDGTSYNMKGLNLVNVPQVKKVLLDASDLKFGDILQVDNNPNNWLGIVGISIKNQTHPILAGGMSYSFEFLRKHCKISRDGGTTWEECSKEIVE